MIQIVYIILFLFKINSVISSYQCQIQTQILAMKTCSFDQSELCFDLCSKRYIYTQEECNEGSTSHCCWINGKCWMKGGVESKRIITGSRPPSTAFPIISLPNITASPYPRSNATVNVPQPSATNSSSQLSVYTTNQLSETVFTVASEIKNDAKGEDSSTTVETVTLPPGSDSSTQSYTPNTTSTNETFGSPASNSAVAQQNTLTTDSLYKFINNNQENQTVAKEVFLPPWKPLPPSYGVGKQKNLSKKQSQEIFTPPKNPKSPLEDSGHKKLDKKTLKELGPNKREATSRPGKNLFSIVMDKLKKYKGK